MEALIISQNSIQKTIMETAEFKFVCGIVDEKL